MLSPEILRHLKAKIDFSLLKSMLKYGVPTLPAGLATVLLSVADKPILKQLTDAETMAVYNANYKLGIPMLLFVSAFEYAWRPFFLSHYHEENSNSMFSRIFTYFTLIGASIFLFISFFIEYIVKIPFLNNGSLLPVDYRGGMEIIPIILVAYWFFGTYNNFAAAVHIVKKTKYIAFSITTGTIFYIIAMYLFIPSFGYIAAAWATLFGYAVNALLILWFARKVYQINYEWKRIFIILLITLFTYVLGNYIISLNLTVDNWVIYLALSALFGILLKVLGFFNEKELKLLKRLIKRK